MSHFLRLPTEVQVMVYEYCLLTSKTINPYPTKFERGVDLCFTEFTMNTEKPTIGLLGVNREVREATSRVFFGKSLLRLPWTSGHPSSLALWGKHNAHFRHVMVDFESCGVSNEARLHLLPHIQLIHDRATQDLLDIWYNKFRLLKNMKLKSLVFDMTKCFCPNRCCRLVKNLCETVLKKHLLPRGLRSNRHRLFLIRLSEVKVQFIGLKSTEERVFIRSMGLIDEEIYTRGKLTPKTVGAESKSKPEEAK